VKVVPRYFMNLRCRGRLFADEERDALPDAAAARAYALETARDLISNGRLDSIRNWYDCDFEITDEAGRLVIMVPFAETVGADEETGSA
jgi:hypothetical protein